MSDYLKQWVQLITTALISSSEPDATAVPTVEERTRAATALRNVETQLKLTQGQIEDSTKLRDQLAKTIEAMEKIYNPAAREAEEASLLARKRQEEARALGATDEALAAIGQPAAELRAQSAMMKDTLDNMRKTQQKAKEAAEKGVNDTNRLKRELQQNLSTYFKTADLKMIADRLHLPLEGNVSFDLNPEFVRRTQVPSQSSAPVPLHFGMDAEHTWDDHYRLGSILVGRTYDLKSIAQHEQVTAAIIQNTATTLLRRSLPGITAPVVRFGMNINDGDFQSNPDAYKGIFGHPVDSFRPTVINNSTRTSFSLEKDDAFRGYMEAFTRGPGTRTITSDNGTMTYGLPPLGRSIVGNAAGNDNWGHQPDPSWIKNFYPNHMNIGVTSIPPVEGGTTRDDKAPSRIEGYSTQNSGVHAVIARPRWNNDGTPILTQYLNPDYERVVEENLWRLTGRPGIPKTEELDDVTKTTPGMLQALKQDKESLLSVIRTHEGVDAAGRSSNMRGTSFAAPTANGVLLAASILYPTASPAELQDAFCSACRPITTREDPTAAPNTSGKTFSDVAYMVEPATGRIYSPMAGFGEFVIDPNATREKPDSWLRLLDRLEAMQQERNRITRNGHLHMQVDVGEGANARRVEITGQPLQATLELTRITEFESEEYKKTMAACEARCREAILNIDRDYDTSLHTEESSPVIQQLLQRHFYKAREALQARAKEIGIPETDPKLQEALQTMLLAHRETGHSYSFTVNPDQDLTLTQAALRLKFKDKIFTDSNMVLESPDGTRIPITLSENHDGVRVASTPGFMRKSAAGTWKIYTCFELESNGSSLVLTGTERNEKLGIIDVRETVLSRIETAEARHKHLPPQNTMKPMGSPFPYMREMEFSGARPGFFSPVQPSTRQEFQKTLEDFINNSALKRGGFIPPGTLDKVSQHAPAITPEKIGAALAAMGCLPANPLLTLPSLAACKPKSSKLAVS